MARISTDIKLVLEGKIGNKEERKKLRQSCCVFLKMVMDTANGGRFGLNKWSMWLMIRYWLAVAMYLPT